jgi:hypothetical protein
MKQRSSSTAGRKLRKQPQMERVYTAAAMPFPQMAVPKTARRRRRRNRRLVSVSVSSLKGFLLSARWISLLILALCGGALALIGMDEGFYLTLVPVEGVASIPPDEVVSASGLGGAHIFAVEPQLAAQRVDDLPGVISATVALEWPNQAVIQIREESPVAVWEQNGQRYWVNEDGELVPARIDIPGLLHIIAEGPAPNPAAVEEMAGETVTDEEEETSSAEAEATPATPVLFVPQPVLQGALLLKELRPNIEALNYDPGAGLSYQDGRGWRAYFGAGTDMAQKLVVYETLVEKLVANGITPQYVSVQNQEKPFYLGQ